MKKQVKENISIVTSGIILIIFTAILAIFIKPLAFCSPEQVLTFLTIFGAVSGSIWALMIFLPRTPKEKKEYNNYFYYKFVPAVSIVIYLLFMFAFGTAYTAYYIQIAFTLIFVAAVIYLYKKRRYVTLIFLLAFLGSYFISGITGNACLYLPIQDSINKPIIVTMQIGDNVTFQQSHDLDYTFKYVLKCSVIDFSIKNITNGFVLVKINDKLNESDSSGIWMRPGEYLTTCAAQHELLNVTNNSTQWVFVVGDDIFSNIRGFFVAKGVYQNS